MRTRKWAYKALWFVIGAVAAASLMFISTSGAVAPTADHERLTVIERRLTAIEERFRQMDKAAAEDAKRPRPRDPNQGGPWDKN